MEVEEQDQASEQAMPTMGAGDKRGEKAKQVKVFFCFYIFAKLGTHKKINHFLYFLLFFLLNGLLLGVCGWSFNLVIICMKYSILKV